ncbi:hypothetical protein [Actinomycetospora atypica]|uniref:Uncharacterized protein n=1 Tax=Actinomycetospora atypica TaxID=1290095 RepID=A0ABV9YRQ4_9PSEU
MRVDSLLQREGRGPVERTGPIPLPGRRPRHLAPSRRPGATGVQPPPDDTVTRPFTAQASATSPSRPGGAAFAVPPGAFPPPGTVPGLIPVVPRGREPRPTPPAGTPAPTLERARAPRPDGTGPVPVDDEPTTPSRRRRRWWPLGRARMSRRALVIALAAVAAVLGAAGIAVAAWLFSGTGRPGVSAGTALAPTTTTVAGSAVTSGLLTPGTTGTAVVTLTNPNPYRVRVTSIAPAGAVTASGGVGTCATTGVSFTAQTPPTLLLVKGASTTLTLPGAVAMSTASESGCQGATFSVPVTVAAVSAP